MAHPQNSPRGLWAKTLQIPASKGLLFADYHASTNLLTGAASGLKVAGGLALSALTHYITQNSTATLFPKGVAFSGEATDVITQNSTAVNFPSQIRLTGTSRFIVANSTGLMIGARYISTNTTSNLTT